MTTELELRALYEEYGDTVVARLPYNDFSALYRDIEAAGAEDRAEAVIGRCCDLCAALSWADMTAKVDAAMRPLIGIATLDANTTAIERSADALAEAYPTSAPVGDFVACTQTALRRLREQSIPEYGRAALHTPPSKRKRGPPGNVHRDLIYELAWWLVDAGGISRPTVVARHVFALLEASGLLDHRLGKRVPTTEASIRSMLTREARA